MRHSRLMRRVAEILNGERDPDDGGDIPRLSSGAVDGIGRYVRARPDGGDPIPPFGGMTQQELDAYYGRDRDPDRD